MKYTTTCFIALVLAFSSCTISSRFKTSEKYVNRQAEASASDARLINKPILADLEVKMERAKTNYAVTNKEIGTSSMVLSGNSRSKSGGNVFSTPEDYFKNEAKKRAQFQFMSEHKCDYLVDPIYKIDTEAKSSSDTLWIRIEILAFPAIYKKFSQPDSLPKCVTQINDADYRGVPLFIGSDEAPEYLGKNRGIVTAFGASTIRNSTSTEPDLSGVFGYYSQRQLTKRLSFRNEFNLVTRAIQNQMEYNEPYYNNMGFFGYDSIEMEGRSRTLGLQLPALFSIDGSRLGFYFGPAINLDFIQVYKYRPVGSSTWESSNSSGIEDAGFSAVLGVNIHVTNKISVGFRHDNGLGDWDWRSNNFCMSFKLN